MEWGEHKGKCISCGYLALRPIARLDHHIGKSGDAVPYTPNAYYEVDTYTRHRLDFDTHCPEGFVGPIKTSPACFRGVTSLTGEIRHYSEEHGGERRATEVVVKTERGCKAWYCYIEGFSPKEHLFMQRFELLEKHREEFEERLEQSRKDYEERAEKDRRKWNTDFEHRLEKDRRDWVDRRDETRAIDQKRNDRLMRRLTYAAVILGLAQVIAAALSLTKDSWIVQLFCKWFAG